jgi:hypothetical protein
MVKGGATMRQYTVNIKKRDLGKSYPLRFTDEAFKAMKILMREYPAQSVNTIINTLITAAGESSKAKVTP